jgi:hypothetical protein
LAVDGWVTIPPPPALRWDHDVDHENARKWITLKAPLKLFPLERAQRGPLSGSGGGRRKGEA